MVATPATAGATWLDVAAPFVRKPAAVYSASSWEDGNKRDEYKYDDNNADWVAGPTMRG